MPLPHTYLEICKTEAHGKNINLQALFADGNILKEKAISVIITKYGDMGTINWWSDVFFFSVVLLKHPTPSPVYHLYLQGFSQKACVKMYFFEIF